MNRLFYIIVLVGSLTTASAQKGWEVGGWLGTSVYYGDLNNKINFKSPGFAGGVLGKYNFNSRVALRSSLNYGRISAADANSDNNFYKARNLSFSSYIFDLSTGVEFNFMNHLRGSKFETYTPFVIVGFSIFKYNPTAELDGVRYDLRDFGTEGQDIGEEYFTMSGGLMLGGGFKWDVSSDMTLAIEFTTRMTFTDYLDDVGKGKYLDAAQLTQARGSTAADLNNQSLNQMQFGYRGDPNTRDWYVFAGIGLTIRLGNPGKCFFGNSAYH